MGNVLEIPTVEGTPIAADYSGGSWPTEQELAASEPAGGIDLSGLDENESIIADLEASLPMLTGILAPFLANALYGSGASTYAPSSAAPASGRAAKHAAPSHHKHKVKAPATPATNAPAATSANVGVTANGTQA